MMTEHTSVAWPHRLAVAGALLVALGLIAGLAWTLSQRTARPPNVLVIAIDSLRRDRVGAYGSSRGLTPFLDELAARSTVYDHAYAPSSWTIPTVASLFTGRHPSEHQTAKFFVPLKESETTLAEALAAYGYATSAVTDNAAIRGDFGFGQGFERYQLVGAPTVFNPKSDGGVVNAQTLRFVDEVGRERPHFIYLHYMDVHAPYRPHEAFAPPRDPKLRRSDDTLNLALMSGSWEKHPERQRSYWTFTTSEVFRLQDLYDSEVQHVDGRLRELFDALGQRGFLDNALVVVTADHGEEFGRHGAFYHGTTLYGAAINVPLIVQVPHQPPQRVTPPVELAGLGAMIADVVGMPRPPSFSVGWLSADPTRAQRATAISELLETGQIKIWSHKRALVGPAAKVIVTSDDQYLSYDLNSDPLERVPRPADDALRSAVDVRVSAMQAGSAGSEVELDEATRERLRAAGYLIEGP
ncbi:MAG: sulfatase [Candidatus Binatia bacterium]